MTKKKVTPTPAPKRTDWKRLAFDRGHEITKLKEENEQLQVMSGRLRSQVAELETRVARLSESNKGLGELTEQLRIKVAETEKGSGIDALCEERDTLRSEVEDLKSNVEFWKNEARSERERLQKSEDFVERLNATLRDREENLQDVSKGNRTLERRVERYEQMEQDLHRLMDALPNAPKARVVLALDHPDKNLQGQVVNVDVVRRLLMWTQANARG